MVNKHTIGGISPSNCVTAGGVNGTHMPTDYDQRCSVAPAESKRCA